MHFLWTAGHSDFFSRSGLEKCGNRECASAFVGRFACSRPRGAYNSHHFPTRHHFYDNVTAALHRFEESIAGRVYLIEVAAVTPDRWRAYIVRIPGVPTALMPFYGSTPDEAAHLLSEWLTRAYARAAPSA